MGQIQNKTTRWEPLNWTILITTLNVNKQANLNTNTYGIRQMVRKKAGWLSVSGWVNLKASSTTRDERHFTVVITYTQQSQTCMPLTRGLQNIRSKNWQNWKETSS